MLNKAIMMGRLTHDPECRQTPAGIPCCRFSIAINRKKQKDGPQETDYVECVAWRSTAEFVGRYFSKGSMIIIDGELRNNNYTDNNGVKHYKMEVLCNEVSFGESKKAADGQQDPQYAQYGAAPQQNQAPPPQYQQQYQAPPQQYQQQYQAPPQQYQQQYQPPRYDTVPPPSGNSYHP